jgi:glucoamylase
VTTSRTAARSRVLPNAVLGDGSLLLTLTCRGRVQQLWWPHLDHEPHLGDLRLGVHDADSFTWLDDPALHHRQRYEDDVDVLVTTVEGGAVGTVEVTDAIATDAPVLVRRVRGARGRVGVFVRPELTGTVQAGGGYVDPGSGALVFHRRDHVVAIGLDVPTSAGVGERDRGAPSDEALAADLLAGGGVVHGEVDGAVLAAEPRDEVVVAIAMARTHVGALERLRSTLHRGAAATFRDRRSAGAKVLAALPAPLVDGPEAALERRSQLVFGLLADRATGGVLAAPEQDPWFARSGGYGYVWPRDLAFILLAHVAGGRHDLAVPALWWLVRSQPRDGLWAQRSWTDGTLAPSWGTQLDETGAVLVAYGAAARGIADDRLIRALWTSTIHAADALVRTLDERTGLPAPSMDLWEERVGLHAYTAAATWAGLQAAGHLADRFEPARATGWREAAARVRAGIEQHLWSEEHGRYLRSIEVARADDAGTEVPGCYAALADHAADPVRSVDPLDPVVDTSLLGLVYPFGVFDAAEPRMAATIAAIEGELRGSDGGLRRYVGDPYIGGNPWVLTTLWMGLVRRRPGAAEPADGLDYARRAATSTGLLPEQVDAVTGEPAWIVPLTWSHAMYVLACRPDPPGLPSSAAGDAGTVADLEEAHRWPHRTSVPSSSDSSSTRTPS